MRTLTSKEAAALAYAPGYQVLARVRVNTYGPPAGMVADANTHRLWRLEGTGSEASDVGTDTLAPTSVTPPSVAGVVGKARQFNQTDAYLKGTVTGASAALIQANVWTFEATCRIDGVHASTGWIVGYGGTVFSGAEADNSQAVVGLTSDGWLRLQIENGAGINTSVIQSAGTKVPQKVWCHVAAVRNGGTLTWYVNGTAVQSQAVGATPTGGSLAAWTVGSANMSTDVSLTTVDEVRISSVARSASEILASYRAAFPSTNPTVIDLTAYNDVDWLESVEYDENQDQPVASATVTVRKNVGEMFLDPFHAGPGGATVPPVIYPGRPFSVETATLPLGSAVQSADWRQVFDGVIDEVESATHVITFTGRDRIGALLQDTFIEEERKYSVVSATDDTNSPTSLQTVIQNILNDNGTGVTLTTLGAPAWALNRFKQNRQPVLDAVRNLALQIGWDCRAVFSNAGVYQLTLFEPARGTTTSLYTWGPHQYRDVTQMKIHRADVRNSVEVIYSDASVIDAATGAPPARVTVRAFDEQSSIKYGRRWMQIAEASNSNIDTGTEAARLAAAALADLKEPFADMSVTASYSYFVQPGDLYTFSANTHHFTSNMQLAVVGVHHSLTRDSASTEMTLRAKPIGSWSEWLARDSRPGIAPPNPVVGPQPPSTVTATATAGGTRVSFTEVAIPGADPLEYECHISLTNGFSPVPATLKGITKTTTFDITGLSAGTTYYVRVVARDTKGNRGAASGQVTVVPLYVGTGLLNLGAVESAIMPLNNAFEDWPDAGLLPPGWSATVPGVISRVAGVSGQYAARVAAVGAYNAIAGSVHTIRPGDSAIFRASVVATGSGSQNVKATLVYLNAAGTDLGVYHVVDYSIAAGAAVRVVQTAGVAPASAAYVRPFLELGAPYGTTCNIIWDSCRLDVVPGWQDAQLSYLNGFGAHGGLPPRIRSLPGGLVELSGAVVPPAGGISAGNAMFALPAGYRPQNLLNVATWMISGGVYVFAAFSVTNVSGQAQTLVSIPAGVATFGIEGCRFIAAA